MHGKNGTNYGFGRTETKKGNMTCCVVLYIAEHP